MLVGPAQTFPFREKVILMAVQTKARTGHSLAPNMPTLAMLRRDYGITARTWKDAAEQMPAAIHARIESLEIALGG